mgnify:CR=1 FL=1
MYFVNMYDPIDNLIPSQIKCAISLLPLDSDNKRRLSDRTKLKYENDFIHAKGVVVFSVDEEPYF